MTIAESATGDCSRIIRRLIPAINYLSWKLYPAMTTTQKTVLVIEDDRDISSTIQSVLSGAGYRVLAASNGQDGRRLIQTQKPDLVLTDMMMPRMGGFPVLEFLAELEDAPPVIMMTANEGSRHKAYAEMLGVVDYLRKPFAMEVMLESVARAIAAKTPET
jgi:DNA-binding response OmpR family regulator